MNIIAHLCLLLTGLMVAFTLSAQPISDKFGKVEDEYVKMEAYKADTSAEAVILFSKGQVNYMLTRDDLQLVHTYHYRIKILRPGGEEYANVSIPYFSYYNYENIGNIKGITHYVDDNGKVVSQKMDKKAIIDEDLDGRYHNRKFTLPNAKPGAIIEYTYKIYSKSWAATRNWYFQSKLPTAYSKYITRLPKDFDFRHLTLGEQYGIDRKVSNSTLGGVDLQETVTTYTAKKIPSLIEEPYVTSMKNYYFRLELQLRGIHIPGIVSQNYIKSWNQLSKETIEDEDFKNLLKPNQSLKDELALILAKAGDDPQDQVAYIYHWVQHNISWDKTRSIYPNKKLNELLRDKKGNGASINVLLVNMLRLAGFKASPMLVCTRSNGMPQSIFPTLRQFNHTIAYVSIEDKGIPLDAIIKLTPYTMLPTQDLNHQAMVINEFEAKWVSISPTHTHKVETTNIFDLAADGTLSGNVRTKDHGYAAYSKRVSLFQADDKEEYIRKKMANGFVDLEITSQEVQSDSIIGEPVIINYEMETSDFVNVNGEYIYLQPMLNKAIKENPFKLDNRTYPVDFAYPRQYKYMMSLKLPEGYVIDESPKSVRIVLPNKDGEFIYNFAVLGNAVQMLSDIKINRTVFDKDAYPLIREFYDMIVAKHAEQLVLKKQEVEAAGEDK